MNTRVRTKCRLFCFLLLSIMVMCIAFSTPVSVGAAKVTKTEKAYDIAVAFDNSGSMYFDESWCRAKYAMEIFASMLDYNKDRLHIFPMWEVTTDGSRPEPEKGGSYAPIEIKSKDDIDKISNMFSVKPWSTPFAPIDEAHEYLKKSNADEKWLIVLTDGAFDQNERMIRATIDLQKRLPALASRDIKIQYLGFGGATQLKEDEANNFFAKSTSGSELKNDLVDICNRIFQRSVLPGDRLNGQSLNLDLSMKNIIVFAQGSNAKITSLKDSNGKQVKISLDSGQRKYSEISANEYMGEPYDKAPVDKTLAGQVVTFTGCPKGNYTLSYSSVESIQIFYEPDIDLEITIKNNDGVVIDKPEDFVAGEYTITSRLVDPATGEDVTSHKLLGNGVDLKTKVKTSKDSDYTSYDNGAKIVFEPDDNTSVYVEGTYLEKYKISSELDPRFDWLKNINVKSANFKIAVSGAEDWYVLRKHEKWKPIKVSMTIDGRPLTEEELLRTKLSVDFENDLEYRCELVPGESAYYIYLAQDDDGKYVEPKTGEYKLTVGATYTDEYGRDIEEGPDRFDFEIQWYSKFWRWLFPLLLFLLAVIIFLIIINIPVLPSAIYLNVRRTCHTVKINGTSIGLSTDLYPGEIRCEAKACTPLKDRSKTTATFEIKEIKPIGSVNWYEIDGYRFKKVNGKYINSDGETISQITPKIKVSDDTELKWNTNRHTVTGRIYINHNN